MAESADKSQDAALLWSVSRLQDCGRAVYSFMHCKVDSRRAAAVSFVGAPVTSSIGSGNACRYVGGQFHTVIKRLRNGH